MISQRTFYPILIPRRSLPVALTAALLTIMLIGCDSGGGGVTPPETENTPPVANAGPDLTGKVCESFELDGSGSSDADGDPLTYMWKKISRIGNTILYTSQTEKARFMVVRGTGAIEIELTVSDGEANDTDTTVITVDALQAIELSGRITSDSTLTNIWTCNSNVDVYVTDAVRVEDGAMLTIPEGVRLDFAPNAYIEVGRSSASGIRALGTEDWPVLMTADAISPAPGHWQGLTFWGDTHPDSRLVHTRLEYCGQGQDGCLWTFNGTFTVQNVEIFKSGSYGVNMAPPGAGGSFGPGSSNLSVYNSALNPIRIEPNEAGALPQGGTFLDNAKNTILVSGGVVSRTQTWPNLGIPYEITDRVRVEAPNNPTLTLLPGTEVRFSDGAYLEVGRGSDTPGALHAAGTADAPIVFTSASSSPQPGDWQGLNFWTESANGNQVDHAVIEYATNLVWFFNDIGVIVTNSTLRNASDCAFRWYPTADHTTNQSDNNTFANNAGGNQCED